MLLPEGDYHFRRSLRLMRVVHSLPYLLQHSAESGTHSTAGLFVKKRGEGVSATHGYHTACIRVWMITKGARVCIANKI